MKSSNVGMMLLVMALVSGCGSGGTSDTGSTTTGTTSSTSGTTSTSTGTTGTTTDTSGSNVLAVTVNGSLCSGSTSGSYVNKPCVSVTICTPGTSTCQTVSDILLDTGSYGLRIFSTALTGVSLTQVASASDGSLAECVQFGDGSALWGPVMTADVVLGGESGVQMPIQVINSSFGSPPQACSSADASPTAAGFNGILGVGLFARDCGAGCVDTADNGMYYSCSGSSCTATTAELAKQVPNPVALLPLDNNGVIVQLPTVATNGAASATGSLTLGIGTRSNNVPSSVTTYPADASTAEFLTTYNGTAYNSFLDTGSNGLYFPATSLLSACTVSGYSSWFCPATTKSLSAVNAGYNGSPFGTIDFTIGSAVTMFNSSYMVFPALGGAMSGGFDWGLPFFLGRNVYVGIDGKGSILGTGPYWAY
ncbi:DUF3443 domain-containing protein [Oryzomonas rubra]|uniref:DUF3443 domain-containing protein n=1 Tax=Oryzomonas rubra TaxID=2509454 RepID=A0A5A9X9B5_9BACT|nr:DUF3443 domain-containing protein [Oryzomonas rubra]KAA0889005.1 DUF3443 domain-containing protein [Oryzomonas rubra]